MGTSQGYNIKLEKSDEEGMIDGDSMIDFFQTAKRSICEIDLPKGFGSGFFCKIPYTEDNNKLIPVLITCNHILSKDLKEKNNIKIILDGQAKTIPLSQRKIWTDEIIDFTCIEIKKKESNIYRFFNLDDNVFTNENYLDQNVLIYAINNTKNGRKFAFSNGTIKSNKDSNFAYTCNTYPGCSGGCIVNQDNNCVIGIHQGEIKTENKNLLNAGIFIRDVIKYIKEHKISSSPNVNNIYNNLKL